MAQTFNKTYPKGKVKPTIFCKWKKNNDGKMYPEALKGTKIQPADQGFKAQTDVNNIVDKAKRTGVLSHVNKHAELYESIEPWAATTYEEAMEKAAKVRSAFYELDADIRTKFDNDPGKFQKWVQPKTVNEIVKEIPALAEPGSQWIDVIHGTTAPQSDHTTPVPPNEPAPPADTGGTEGGEA